MISPEHLRKYAFFGFLDDDDFGKVAMASEEASWKKGETLFDIHEKATYLYFIESGNVELHYMVVDDKVSDKSKEFYVGDANPGEPLGFSAFIEPYEYTATALAATDSTGLVVDVSKLKEMAADDPALGYRMMTQVATDAFKRLGRARVELVAARE